MLRVTKIFRFETAHAINGYNGSCRHIHGHSYVLHVTVQPATPADDFLPPPGFVIDFKDLKAVVQESVFNRFDHRIILSEAYIQLHPNLAQLQNLEVWPMEPTAENILLQVKASLQKQLPADVILSALKIYETADSYAEWTLA
ncbi:MAG TPA: 6-carboxytetrahydropterin synthase [Phnomibacter sp.]|nr:6-carboxytetrahydropterin synthase [Phnomibacter sp.]